jgi:hypothetical protein
MVFSFQKNCSILPSQKLWQPFIIFNQPFLPAKIECLGSPVFLLQGCQVFWDREPAPVDPAARLTVFALAAMIAAAPRADLRPHREIVPARTVVLYLFHFFSPFAWFVLILRLPFQETALAAHP